jgi:hypothetical protein
MSRSLPSMPEAAKLNALALPSDMTGVWTQKQKYFCRLNV